MTIKAILFDNDGVLMHPPEMFSQFFSREYGVPSEEIIPFFKGPFQDCILGEADLKEVITPWLSKWNWNKSFEEFIDLWFSSEDVVDQEVVIKIQSLRSRGIKCYLATNQEKYRISWISSRFKEVFDDIFASSYLNLKKPNKEFYLEILKKLELNPEEVIYLDDEEQNILSAREIGLHSIYYKNKNDLSEIDKLLE